MGKNINNYHLVDYKINLYEHHKYMKEINEELAIISEEDILASSTLNAQEKYAYDMILEKAFNNEFDDFFD